MLESWAVEEGVQSTTRYRKANSSRRYHTISARSQPYSLELRTGSSRVLASHGDAWRRRDLRLRRPSFGHGLPTAPFSDDVSGRSFPCDRSASPGICHDTYSFSPTIGSGSLNTARQETHGLALDHGLPQPHPFGIMMSNPSLAAASPTGVTSMGSHTISSDVPSTLYYGLTQGAYPYHVSDVHIGYYTRPQKSDDKNVHPTSAARSDHVYSFRDDDV